ncbi:hypothetical protein Ddc_19340 [Ditylenchus destructor]|nr:hypothetical protein Ddc_19340 [Ditylenchus destructor]
MEIGVRYETISAELMYQHTSTVHLGIEPDVRFSTTEENELKIAIEKCRQSIGAEQVSENDSKQALRQVFISLGTALADSGTNDTGNGVLSAEDEADILEVPERSNRDHIETTIEGEVRRPDADVSIQQNAEDVRPLMIREDELNTAIENNRNSIGDTLADTGKSATSTEVISTEIKQEDDNLEVHESTNNDNIGPTNEGLIYGIQPENVTTRGNEPNFNVDLHSLIHSIKAENDSSRCDEPNLNVNGQENTEEIDSQIPLVSSTEPTAVVETQENVTNPISNSENTSALNAKSESPEIDSQIPLVSSTEPTAVVITQRNVADPVASSDNTSALNPRLSLKVESVENVSTVPIGLRLEAALSSYVPIDVEANEAQHNPVIPKGRTSRISLSSERRYPKKRRSSMEALNNDEPTTSVEPKRRGRKRRGEANSESNLQTKQLKRAKNPNRYAENVAECSAHQKLLEKYRSLQKKPAAEPSTVANSLPAQRSSEVNQSTAHNSNGDTNENGLLQNPQVALDARIDPAQKMKITHIRINISNGETCFRSTSSKPYHYVWHPPRPLSEYVSILRESEPDEPVCEAHIFYPFDNQKDRCPERARKKMEELSQEVHSIAHLWANGRVVADLLQYFEYDHKILPLPDFCDIFFSQDRSILKCKTLGVTLDSCWPMSIVTNAARHCSKLTLKETGYCDKQQHFRRRNAKTAATKPFGLIPTVFVSPSSQTSDLYRANLQGHWRDLNFAEEDGENEEPSITDVINEENELNQLHFQREAEREGARTQQKRQAEQMLEGSAKRFAPIPVGQTVRVPIPMVDRAKTDPRVVLGVVMDAEDGFYRIGTGAGILNQKYSRNQIDPSSSKHVSLETVPNKEISLRTAVGADSLSGSQGHIHCACLQGCKTGKCKCKSLERLCNSRCHNSSSCKNK